MELYSEDVRKKFEDALSWLNKWACSRSYGLGTRLPFDEQFLIESLSDSTIYTAYYTVAHILQNDIEGKEKGPYGIDAKQMTPEVWDFIFRGGKYPTTTSGISEEALKRMKQEFDYWYPFDLRVSGKDLIQNHLVFALYNHVAVLLQSKSPLSFRVNGHMLLDNEKMSKSTGNFLTLEEGMMGDRMEMEINDGFSFFFISLFYLYYKNSN